MKIYENFLPKPLFETIRTITMKSDFPYKYEDTTADQNDNSHFFFCHMIFKNGRPTDWLMPIVYPLMAKVEHSELIRAKVNLYTKTPKPIVTGFHIDGDFDHKVLLYSVNTNNGYTFFENGEKVPSIANQAVIFDGKLKHSSVTQTDENVRVNININYK